MPSSMVLVCRLCLFLVICVCFARSWGFFWHEKPKSVHRDTSAQTKLREYLENKRKSSSLSKVEKTVLAHWDTVADIRAHQYPPDCANRKFMRLVNWKYGFGSLQVMYGMCLLKAMATGHILVHHETRPVYRHLRPWTNCSVPLLTAARQDFADCVHVKTDKLSAVEEKFGYMWSLLHAIAFVTDFQPAPRCGDDRYAVLQVRRTDKVTERPYIPTAAYMAELEKGQRTRVFGRTDVQLVTDAPADVRKEFQEYVAREHRAEFFALREVQLPVGRNSSLLGDLQAMRCSDPLAIMATSNFGILGMALKVHYDLRECRPGHLLLMDTGSWWKGFYTVAPDSLLGFDQYNTSWGVKWPRPPGQPANISAAYLQ
eukprot:EG_transcript_11760